MTMEQPKEQAATWVLWDINRCPVPSDVDARRVGPCIKRAVKNLGYTGPLTIIAIGILTEVSHYVLRDLSSTGIVFKHVPTDMGGISNHLFGFSFRHPPPANLMLISGEPNFAHILARLKELEGYNILWSISSSYPGRSSTGREGYYFLWETLQAEVLEKYEWDCSETEATEEDCKALKENCNETDALEENCNEAEALEKKKKEENCNEIGASAFVCSTCNFNKVVDFQAFDAFIRHLYSKKHALEEMQYYPAAVKASPYGNYHKERASFVRSALNMVREDSRRRVREEEEEMYKQDPAAVKASPYCNYDKERASMVQSARNRFTEYSRRRVREEEEEKYKQEMQSYPAAAKASLLSALKRFPEDSRRRRVCELEEEEEKYKRKSSTWPMLWFYFYFYMVNGSLRSLIGQCTIDLIGLVSSCQLCNKWFGSDYYHLKKQIESEFVDDLSLIYGRRLKKYCQKVFSLNNSIFPTMSIYKGKSYSFWPAYRRIVRLGYA